MKFKIIVEAFPPGAIGTQAQKAPSARPDMAALFYGSYHGGQQHEVACKHYNLTPPSMFEMA